MIDFIQNAFDRIYNTFSTIVEKIYNFTDWITSYISILPNEFLVSLSAVLVIIVSLLLYRLLK